MSASMLRFSSLRGLAPRSAPVSHCANLPGPLVVSSLVESPVDPVAEDVGGLVRQRLVEVPEHDAHQQVLLARAGPKAGDCRCGQLRPGGGRKYPDFLDTASVRAKGLPDLIAEGLLVLVGGYGN